MPVTRSAPVCARRGVVVLALLAVGSTVVPAVAQPTKLACIAANESAQDLRRAGRLRAARAKLVECVAAACPGPLREDCAARLSEVDAAMPTLVLEARDEGGRDVATVRVTMDGQPFAARLDGAAVPTDPGEHTFTFEADGHPRATKVIVVREGDKGRHERVTLSGGEGVPAAPAKSAPGAAGASNPIGAAGASSESGATPHERPLVDGGVTASPPGQAQRVIGLALGGAGVAGLALGGVFGLVSKSTYDNALSSQCANRDPTRCSPAGQDDGRTAHQQATVSTVGFIAGGALLAAGVVVYLAAPRVAVAPMVGSNGGGVAVGGAW
jgi:hypothetical protein